MDFKLNYSHYNGENGQLDFTHNLTALLMLIVFRNVRKYALSGWSFSTQSGPWQRSGPVRTIWAFSVQFVFVKKDRYCCQNILSNNKAESCLILFKSKMCFTYSSTIMRLCAFIEFYYFRIKRFLEKKVGFGNDLISESVRNGFFFARPQ